MKATSQFVESKIKGFKNYKSYLKNMEPLIGEPEFWDSMDDPFIDKLVTQMEKTNRFHNCFDVEAF